MENGEQKMGEKNVIFQSLVKVKNKRKANGVNKSFLLGLPFFFPLQIEEKKKERKWDCEEKYITISIFSFSTFNNKNITVIYFYHFLSTKHT